MKIELIIQNEGSIYMPLVEENIVWSTERRDSPGQLSFTVLKDNTIDFQEGNPVRLKVDGTDIFYGYVFTKKRDKDGRINVTAYDQLRYLKNKDTYIYKHKTASELIQMVAQDFNLQIGRIEDTAFKIESRVEDNCTLFDIIGNALDLTIQNTNQMFILFDDFGKISLRNLSSMRVGLLIDEESGENFSYSSSIDTNTYNKIKLIYENEEAGKRDVYLSQDSNHINDWGILQYFDKIKEGEDGKAKSNALLSLYNHKTRTLSLQHILGDLRVRAGSMIVVKLNLGDVILSNWMLVEKCKHTFKEREHTMDLAVRGGEFNE